MRWGDSDPWAWLSPRYLSKRRGPSRRAGWFRQAFDGIAGQRTSVGGRRRQAEANSTVPPKTVIRQLLIFPLKLRPSTLIATALTDAAEQEEKMPGTVLAWCSLRPPGKCSTTWFIFV